MYNFIIQIVSLIIDFYYDMNAYVKFDDEAEETVFDVSSISSLVGNINLRYD